MPKSDTKHNSYIQYRQKTHAKSHHIDLDLGTVAHLLTIDPVIFLHTRSLIKSYHHPITISTACFALRHSNSDNIQHSQTIEFKFNACAIPKSFSSVAFLCTRAAYLCNLFRMNHSDVILPVSINIVAISISISHDTNTSSSYLPML